MEHGTPDCTGTARQIPAARRGSLRDHDDHQLRPGGQPASESLPHRLHTRQHRAGKQLHDPAIPPREHPLPGRIHRGREKDRHPLPPVGQHEAAVRQDHLLRDAQRGIQTDGGRMLLPPRPGGQGTPVHQRPAPPPHQQLRGSEDGRPHGRVAFRNHPPGC